MSASWVYTLRYGFGCAQRYEKGYRVLWLFGKKPVMPQPRPHGCFLGATATRPLGPGLVAEVPAGGVLVIAS